MPVRNDPAEALHMARSHTIEAQTQLTEQPSTQPPGGFGAEFRELARQRRFVREDAVTTSGAHHTTPAAPPAAAPVTPAPRAPLTPRISEDQRAMLAELARMSDRLVESREALATMTARAEHAEAEVVAANNRIMAARALVHDAQQATRASAERCAWLEGRCETLQEALDIAVHASLLTRWRWRRQARGAQR
jgi:hypothetical protein